MKSYREKNPVFFFRNSVVLRSLGGQQLHWASASISHLGTRGVTAGAARMATGGSRLSGCREQLGRPVQLAGMGEEPLGTVGPQGTRAISRTPRAQLENVPS